MAEKLTRIVHDCETGITSEVELTAEEIKQREADALAAAETKAAEETAAAELAAKKQAVLDRLGITEDEAKALLA